MMPIYNEILAARFNNLLGRLFGMEKLDVSPSLAPEIQPVFPVEPDRFEHRLPLGIESFVGVSQQIAVVAEQAHVGLFNRAPAGSGRIVVLEFAAATFDTNGFSRWRRYSTELTGNSTANVGVHRDGRRPQRSGTTAGGCVQRQSNATDLGGDGTIKTARVLAGVESQLAGVPFLLMPQSGIYVTHTTTNVEINAWFSWYERTFRPEELDV